MKLLLVRHGNTFDPGQESYWVGKSNNIPLSQSGKKQIERLANHLRDENLFPNQIFCSELDRTYQTADIINKNLNLNLAINVDARLNEIDYGSWSGLTNQQIIEKYGEEDLKAWQEKSIWPQNANWKESENIIVKNIENLVFSIGDKSDNKSTILLVSSNGVIRYFLKLLPNLWEEYVKNNRFKVATASYSVLEKVELQWVLHKWDERSY